MKKIIISIAALVVAAAATVAMASRSESYSLFDANVEALAQLEGVTGIGRICAYEPNNWCIYLYPYEEYEGIFISDIVRGE